MKIPRTFRCANRTWRVRYRAMPNSHGMTVYKRCVMYLDTPLRRRKNHDMRDHTFLHELLHVCAGTMGWKQVNNDEARIDALAALLAQALETSRGKA